MNLRRNLLPLLILSLVALFAYNVAQAQDVHTDCSQNATCTLTPGGGLSWANANQTFIFTPLNPAESVLIYVHNNNPSNGHTLTLTAFQTHASRPTAPSLSLNADFWTQDSVTQSSVTNASCNSVAANTPSTPGASGTGTCYIVGMFASQIAIKITGASAQAGSPDTFDLVIVQQVGYPGGPAPGADTSAAGSTKTLDLCQSPNVQKQTAIINIASATTTQIISFGGSIANPVQAMICSWTVTLTGTTPAFKWIEGTGATCASLPADVTGTYAPTSGSVVSGSELQFLPAGQTNSHGLTLCIVSTGTGPSIQGHVTFAVQSVN